MEELRVLAVCEPEHVVVVLEVCARGRGTVKEHSPERRAGDAGTRARVPKSSPKLQNRLGEMAAPSSIWPMTSTHPLRARGRRSSTGARAAGRDAAAHVSGMPGRECAVMLTDMPSEVSMVLSLVTRPTRLTILPGW